MAQWCEGNNKLFREERRALASAFPLLRLAVVGPGFKINSVCILKHECAIVHGIYNLVGLYKMGPFILSIIHDVES